MPNVKFSINDASDADNWTVFVPAIQEQPIILKPGKKFEKEMTAGTYDYQFSISGPAGRSGTLTISRPKFKDKIIKLVIAGGGGTALPATFRVVN